MNIFTWLYDGLVYVFAGLVIAGTLLAVLAFLGVVATMIHGPF